MAIDPVAKNEDAVAEAEMARALTGALGARPAAPAPRPADIPAEPSAANDDRAAVGSILRSLQRRPQLTPYQFAALASAIWLAAGLLSAFLFSNGLRDLLSVGGAAIPVVMGLGALLLVPVSFFFLLAHMAWRAQELRILSQSLAKVVVGFADLAPVARERINSADQSVRRDIAAMSESIDHALVRASELESRVRTEVSTLERAQQESEERMRGVAQNLAQQNAKIAAQTEQVHKAVAAAREYSEKALQVMQGSIDGMAARFEEKAAQLTTGLDQRLTLFQSAIDTRGRAVDETLTSRTEAMTKVVTEMGRELSEALDRKVADMKATLDTHGTAVAATIGGKFEEMDKSLDNRITTVTRNLDTKISEFENFAAGRAQAAAVEIEARSRNTVDAFNQHLTRITHSIGSNAAEAADLIDKSGKAAAEALGARTQEIAQTIDGRSSEARQALSAFAEEIERRLSVVASNTSTTVNQGAQLAERALLKASGEATQNLNEASERITSAIRTNSTEMTALLDERSGHFLAAMTQHGERLVADVGRTTENAVEMLGAHGQTFAHAVTENGARIAREIAAATESATEALGSNLKEIEHTAKVTIERAQQATSASLSEVRQVHDMLRSDSNVMFERLREANVLLREALSGSEDNISALEKALGERVSGFVSTMKAVTDQSGLAADELNTHIASFQQAAVRVVDDLADIGIQFESHGKSLMQAVDLIDNINRRTMDTITDRSTALDRLVSALDAKAADFEQRLLRFSSLLDESLDDAASRTRDIGMLVAEASTQGVRAIGEQYELVRGAVEQENQRTSDALRGVYERTLGDSQTMLTQATERFNEILKGVRTMSTELQKELEAASAEMRRRLTDIPRETAEGVTQLRQVILEQVGALTELQRVVAENSRGAALRSKGEDAAPAQPEPAKAEQRPARRLAAVAPAAAEQPRAETTEARGAWISDLLHRTTGKEAKVAAPATAPAAADTATAELPRYSIGSLDALSSQIGGLIDSNTVAGLWDRYNRGERGVFTRNLYGKDGQKTFDEVRTRYGKDRSFQQTADRYMGEFERLLDEVAQDKRGQALVRTYLTSETGKVYTMLAHAAGRLD